MDDEQSMMDMIKQEIADAVQAAENAVRAKYREFIDDFNRRSAEQEAEFKARAAAGGRRLDEPHTEASHMRQLGITPEQQAEFERTSSYQPPAPEPKPTATASVNVPKRQYTEEEIKIMRGEIPDPNKESIDNPFGN